MSSEKDKMIEKYQNILPTLLLKHWEKYGFGAFKNGLYWLVNPQEHQGLLEAYTKGTILQDHPRLHVIARSAFGRLYAWEEKKGMSLELDFLQHQIYYMSKESVINKIDEEAEMQKAFSSIENTSEVYDENHQPLFHRAVEEFGILAQDDMYAFKTQLYMGGQNNIENLNRVNLFIHADIQNNITEPPVLII